MMLAAMKLGLVLIPAMPQLGRADIADRLERGRAKFLVAHGADAEKFDEVEPKVVRIAVGEAPDGWRAFDQLLSPNARFQPDGADPRRRPDAALLHLGHDGALETRRPQPRELSDRPPFDHVRARAETRRRPPQHLLARLGEARLVERVRALERRGDRGLARGEVRAARGARRARRPRRHHLLRAADRVAYARSGRPLRLEAALEAAGDHVVGRAAKSGSDRAGPARLGPHAAGLLRADGDDHDGRQFAGPEGDPGSMGRVLPGYRIALLDADGLESDHGEIVLPLRPRPAGLMRGYADDTGGPPPVGGAILPHGRRRLARRRGLHHLRRPGGRRVQVERLPAQPVRARKRAHGARGGDGGGRGARARPGAVHHAKSFIVLAAGFAPDAETAASIFAHVRERLSPYKRVRRIEFCELPKTPSGKIRRVELRRRETDLADKGERAPGEFRIEDFPEG